MLTWVRFLRNGGYNVGGMSTRVGVWRHDGYNLGGMLTRGSEFGGMTAINLAACQREGQSLAA